MQICFFFLVTYCMVLFFLMLWTCVMSHVLTDYAQITVGCYCLVSCFLTIMTIHRLIHYSQIFCWLFTDWLANSFLLFTNCFSWTWLFTNYKFQQADYPQFLKCSSIRTIHFESEPATLIHRPRRKFSLLISRLNWNSLKWKRRLLLPNFKFFFACPTTTPIKDDYSN